MKWCFDSDAQIYECVLNDVNPGEVIDIDGFIYMIMSRDYTNEDKNYINCVKIYDGKSVPFNENTLVYVYPNAKLNIK